MPLKELDSIPELRDDPSLKDFNDLPTLAKSYRETKAFVGSSIRPPGPDASPEAKKDFLEKLQKHAPNLMPFDEKDEAAMNVVWGKLGRPSKPEEYAFQVPAGVNINLDALRGEAVAVGATKAQFEKMAARAIAAAQNEALAMTKGSEALRAKWGTAYEGKLKAAAAVAARLNIAPEAVGNIMAGKLAPQVLETWDAIATAVGGEGKGPTGQGGGGGEGLTAAEAQARFAEIQAHPAYFNRNHPEHATYVEKGFAIQKLLHPG